MTDLPKLHQTPIPGLQLIELDLRPDNRGWFKENWQREKMLAAGLPDFGPVQNNISFNNEVGVTRGLHAEPWDKLISVGAGRIFGAWVDVRKGPTFGQVFSAELGPGQAVYVPRGVANGYQTLEQNTCYTYLANDHWSPAAAYTCLNLADPMLGIDWPIGPDRMILSEKDQNHPLLTDVVPFAARRWAIAGSGGQLATSLSKQLAALGIPFDAIGKEQLDYLDTEAIRSFGWGAYDVVVNAGAFTDVDGAETPSGRRLAWAINAAAVAELAAQSNRCNFELVHVSSDYVFDGTREVHSETEPFSPLNVYGQTKAAGDLALRTARRHYLCRTSWVIGEGKNFVLAMAGLAERGICPAVVSDQRGRLTFSDELARVIIHLVTTNAEYGTYNVTNSGPVMSWADIAREVFRLLGHNPARIRDVTTADYFKGSPQFAERPMNSVLDLTKVEATDIHLEDARSALTRYLEGYSKLFCRILGR